MEDKTETLFHVVFPDYTPKELYENDPLLDAYWRDFASHGYRRQGRLVYRPYCSDCDACVATRVIVNEFDLKRRFRRIIRANSGYHD